MCGLVGLHLKNPGLEPRLGELLTMMLQAMTTRGPDSAGIAVYADHGAGPRASQALQYSLRCDEAVDWDQLASDLAAQTAGPVRARALAGDLAVLTSAADEASFLGTLRRIAPQVAVAGYGAAMVVVKDVGAPAQICSRYGIPEWAG